jgi:dTDP-4-dehydrorhamnose reductase
MPGNRPTSDRVTASAVATDPLAESVSITERSDTLDRIAVTGARGQLGRRLCELLGPRALPLDAKSMDLADAQQMRARLNRLQPRLLINTAAYTAVDAAESDSVRCLAVNRDAVETLVHVTAALNCPLVQISTDYVFCEAASPGRPFRESDPVAPQGVYAQSKAEAEQAALAHPDPLIIRTCGIYGPVAPGASGNFVNTMLRLGRQRSSVQVVDDQICCPTYVVELADALLHLVFTGQRGIFHVVNREALSWCEFAREIFRLTQLDCAVVPISSETYGAAAPRPHYSELDTSKYQRTAGPPLSTCRDALARYLA